MAVHITGEEILIVAEDDPGDEVEIIRDVNLAKLRWPSNKYEARIQNRAYENFGRVSWETVQEVLAREEAFLARYSRLDGETSKEFHSRVLNAELTSDDWEDLCQQPGGLFDIGVASAVFALLAAGCLTVTSCNGGEGHPEPCPLVSFWCRPTQVPSLLSHAEEAGCGLENSVGGTLIVYAVDIHNLLSFARALLARRSTLRTLRVWSIPAGQNKRKMFPRKKRRNAGVSN